MHHEAQHDHQRISDLQPISEILPHTVAIQRALGPDWPHLARLVIDPSEIADCGLWPDEMGDAMTRALLEALQRLDAQRIPIEVDTIDVELQRCGHDSREILRRLRLTLYAIDRLGAAS